MSVTPRLRRAAPRPTRAEPDGRRPRKRARVLLASAGIALVAALGGCSLLGLGSDSGSDSWSGGADGSASPGGSPLWFWAQQGQRVASPAAPPLPALTTPGAGLSTGAGGVVTYPPASARPYCLARLRANTMYWLNATPGVGQASVSWMSLGDPRIVEYKIAAVLQNRPGGSVPPATWTTVPKPNGCQQVNATVTGLTKGNWYVFWLDVVVTTLPTGRREPMIGRSAAFLVQ